MTQSSTSAPHLSLLDQVRQDLRSEDPVGAEMEGTSAAGLGVPSRVVFGEAVNELVDEILMSSDAAPPALRNKVADRVDATMQRRRRRSGYVERLLRTSRLEQHRTIADVAESIGIKETLLSNLEEGLQELRAIDTEVIALWIHQLERLDSEVEAALWRSAETTAMPQTDLIMAGEDDRPRLAASESFVNAVLERLRELEG